MFNFKKNAVVEAITDKVNEITEEWVWVDGAKGTDAFMQCRGFQYELGKQYDIPENESVELCASGFHLCLRLQHVFQFYGFDNNNRFFRVRALVRKRDLERYDSYKDEDGYWRPGEHKLAAKSIIFVEEYTTDYLCAYFGISDWSDDNKKLARSIGVSNAKRCINVAELVNLGYSETFARLIVEDNGRFEMAKAVGTQDGLSMDMKAWLIFTCKG